MSVAPPMNRASKRRSGLRGKSSAPSAGPLPIICIDDAKRHTMSLSEQILKKEDLRSHLFGEVWRTLIPEVFRDVPTYYDQGNAVASLGSCSRWSATFARAIHRHLPRGTQVLDVCSGTHDIPLRLLALDPTLKVHAVDGSAHMTAEGQRRARERKLTIDARVCDAHALPFPDNSFDAVTLQFASRHL
jgi:demethylmenaquinone methyltransferase / 2-methoxy-6-polyprenyl-1,4-benzoquinol methylase